LPEYDEHVSYVFLQERGRIFFLKKKILLGMKPEENLGQIIIFKLKLYHLRQPFQFAGFGARQSLQNTKTLPDTNTKLS
jgi:hypothetical protein